MKVVNITEVMIKLQFELPQTLISRGFTRRTVLFATNLIKNSFKHLQNEDTKCDIQLMPRSKLFSLDVNEWRNYINLAKILVGRIFTEFSPKFHFLKDCITSHIEHTYSDQMTHKSNIISMPIINANEASYACVKILRTSMKDGL